MYIEERAFDGEGKYYVRVYVQDETPEIPLSHKRPMVVVCPGGGYCGTSDREAEPIALAYIAAGFNAALVRYPVGNDAAWPAPQVAVSKALKYIRANSERFLTDPQKIAVCGFSAGGHLAASMGVHWNDPAVRAGSGCYEGENRPDALILAYPVITGVGETHSGTIDTLIREYVGTPEYGKMREYVSNERYVKQGITPPAFIFSTWEDNAVPIINSVLFAKALAEEHIPAEVHIFQKGAHGVALADHRTYIVPANLAPDSVQWMSLSTDWLWNLFGKIC